jgi:hypothetical protein
MAVLHSTPQNKVHQQHGFMYVLHQSFVVPVLAVAGASVLD